MQCRRFRDKLVLHDAGCVNNFFETFAQSHKSIEGEKEVKSCLATSETVTKNSFCDCEYDASRLEGTAFSKENMRKRRDHMAKEIAISLHQALDSNSTSSLTAATTVETCSDLSKPSNSCSGEFNMEAVLARLAKVGIIEEYVRQVLDASFKACIDIESTNQAVETNSKKLDTLVSRKKASAKGSAKLMEDQALEKITSNIYSLQHDVKKLIKALQESRDKYKAKAEQLEKENAWLKLQMKEGKQENAKLRRIKDLLAEE